jgi:DNA (cytosine-5)-methyltransferase 1
MSYTVGSLFSGIGGLDLGLERAGMKVIWQSEIDPFASKVLKKHWPKVTNYGDIKQIDWAKVKRPDIICGGYPCQPFSLAGQRKGIEDPRHLWPWVRDAISALSPTYAILENVRGHLSMGGLRVIGDLTDIGYNAEWRIVSAAGVGAPHKRERVIIVAYPHDRKLGDIDQRGIDEGTYGQRRKVFVSDRPSGSARRTNGNWLSEPSLDRVANGVPDRVDRLRGLGNAVVPQLAEYVGRLIMAKDTPQ